ncbi:MAG TPA: glycosyltransferase [Gemmatimonadales bacterium]|nr:glycosyltransferase [Gemmatimonadales bacterium]
MTTPKLRIVILGLSITSSWGNGHATTYRGLVRELAALGHDVLFLERDVPWYADNRDLERPARGRVALYRNLGELRRRFASQVREADLVVVGSYVPEGAKVGEWVTRTAHGVTAFYDIDTPVTLARLARGEVEYLTRALIPRYDLYLSFTGGPTLERLELEYGAQAARALYCSVDPTLYGPEDVAPRYDLGYMGTYSADRQRGLTHLLMEPARLWWEGRFAVVGPQYPDSVRWPANVRRIEHLPPDRHRGFYNSQRFTLNLTRADMIAAGFSPSVRLFEAAACGTPIVSDAWDGMEQVLTPGREILLARSAADVLAYVRDLPDEERRAIGRRARDRVLAEHTAAHRAEELVGHMLGLLARPSSA